MARFGVVLSVLLVVGPKRKKKRRRRRAGEGEKKVRKKTELEGRRKVEEERLNRRDKPLEVVLGEPSNLIGCHLLQMGF